MPFRTFTTSLHLYTWMSCVLPFSFPLSQFLPPTFPPSCLTSLPPYLPSLLTSLSLPSYHFSFLSLPPPPPPFSPLTRLAGFVLFWVFSRLFNQIYVQKRHIAMLKQAKMVGLRRWRIAGGGGRGHSLNHSLTVNNVQCTQEWIRTAG